jgi:hypothetical protein
MRKLLFTLVIFGGLFVFGCSYHKADLIYPTVPLTNCDTTSTIKYSTDVVNILRANCYVCHGGNAASGNSYILDTYAGVKFMADNGRLVRAIAYTGPANTNMPQFGFKMPECNIAKIRTWVRKGALNN